MHITELIRSFSNYDYIFLIRMAKGKIGRGNWRGRGRGRGKGWSKKIESSEESEKSVSP